MSTKILFNTHIN
jgi:hypothetical protein